MVTGYSILVILHPDEKIKYMSIVETVCGFGFSFGPIFGSILYTLFGYFAMFLIQGLVTLALILIIKLTIPPNIDDADNAMILNDNELKSDMKITRKISYYGLLSDHVVFL